MLRRIRNMKEELMGMVPGTVSETDSEMIPETDSGMHQEMDSETPIPGISIPL